MVSVKRISHKPFDEYRRHRGARATNHTDNSFVNSKVFASSPEPRSALLLATEGGVVIPFAWVALQMFLESIQRETGLSEISPKSQRLLEWIYTREESGDSRGLPLPLQFVAGNSPVGSMATVYQMLFELARLGFIDIAEDPLDTRRKVIRTTKKTRSLMMALAKSAENWAARLREQSKKKVRASRSSSL